MSFRNILLKDISLVTLSRTVYIDDISATRWNFVDISNSLNNEFPQGNPEYLALSNLREYKNREGLKIYDDPYARTRIGRTTGANTDFTRYDYETRKMRRKAESLQYKDNSLTKNELYKQNIGLNNPKKISQTKLKQLRDTNAILNCNTKVGSCNPIVYDTSIPFVDKL
jgi:hypothetical protein